MRHTTNARKGGVWRRSEAVTQVLATKQSSYTGAFKLEIVKYVQKYGNHCGGRVLDVCKKLTQPCHRGVADVHETHAIQRMRDLKYGCNL